MPKIIINENQIEGESVSTPREDFTPYMHGMLSPEKNFSHAVSSQKEVSNGKNNYEAAKKMKLMSFENSRCSSSPADAIMGASLSSH
mmetsp:Transcript_15443/g.19476  ORF Transcript_15443/g.19476 Transcript_15443/m.19476 type:complete len:87 (+) Transcript_15443:89-349(+)